MAVTRRVAKVLLLDAQQNFLLLARTDDHPYLGGYHDLPGGTVEDGEDFGEAIIREVAEETGIIVSLADLRVLYTTTQLLNGRSYPTLLYVGHVDNEKPPVQISWEHKSYEWAPLGRLAEVEPQLAPTYREALNYIRANDIIEDINKV